MQPGRVTDDWQVRDLPFDMITKAAGHPALSAVRVQRDRGAEQVRELVGHGGIGDRHPELDGAADGVGKQAGGSVQSGSWGCEVLV